MLCATRVPMTEAEFSKIQETLDKLCQQYVAPDHPYIFQEDEEVAITFYPRDSPAFCSKAVIRTNSAVLRDVLQKFTKRVGSL